MNGAGVLSSPIIVDAMCALDDIPRRTQTHQRKKRTMLRPLKLADNLAGD